MGRVLFIEAGGGSPPGVGYPRNLSLFFAVPSMRGGKYFPPVLDRHLITSMERLPFNEGGEIFPPGGFYRWGVLLELGLPSMRGGKYFPPVVPHRLPSSLRYRVPSMRGGKYFPPVQSDFCARHDLRPPFNEGGEIFPPGGACCRITSLAESILQ